MTREELDDIKALLPVLTMKHLDPQPFSDVVVALESAWHRIDEVERQNLDLTAQRDAAIMDGMALTVEKDGLMVEIERLTGEVGAWTSKAILAEIKVEKLERGEYICKKCGLRKDGESADADF